MTVLWSNIYASQSRNQVVRSYFLPCVLSLYNFTLSNLSLNTCLNQFNAKFVFQIFDLEFTLSNSRYVNAINNRLGLLRPFCTQPCMSERITFVLPFIWYQTTSFPFLCQILDACSEYTHSYCVCWLIISKQKLLNQISNLSIIAQSQSDLKYSRTKRKHVRKT